MVCFGTWGLRFFEEVLDCVGCYEAGCKDALAFLEGLDLVGLARDWDWDWDWDTECLLSARIEVISVSSSASSGSGDVRTRDVIFDCWVGELVGFAR